MKYVFKVKVMPSSNLSNMTDSFPTLHPPSEPPPVGKHHEQQFLPVEVFADLVRLVKSVNHTCPVCFSPVQIQPQVNLSHFEILTCPTIGTAIRICNIIGANMHVVVISQTCDFSF